MKIKTSELSGVQLDWAVAKCEGEEVRLEKGQLEALWTDNGYKPSTYWAQGGPIIEREGVLLEPQSDHWDATLDNGDYVFWRFGPTPLIAAMRCYVANKLGEEVEIPEEVCDESL